MSRRATGDAYETAIASSSPATPRPPRASAAVVPWRTGDDGTLEVYWVRRSPALRFMGGWHAFPGGAVGRGDSAVTVAGAPRGGADDGFTRPGPEADGDPAALRLAPDLAPGVVAAAIRELFEETGLLLAAEVLADRVDPGALERARRRLLAGEPFADLVREGRWRLVAEPLSFAGRWLTPPVAPLRFDNRFFLLEWPRERGVQPSIARTEPGGGELGSGELDAGEWIAPAAALAAWRRGEAIAAPPILHLLRVLAEDGPRAGTPRLLDTAEADIGPFRRIEFRPGVLLLPVATATLPPATHTNTLVLGRDRRVVVDPAGEDPAERRRLLAALDILAAEAPLVAVWLTHHHRDHVGAVETVRERFGIPVAAHPETARRLAERGLTVDERLEDDQRVELGDPGGDPFPIRVLHTPGHTRGHLAFFDETHGSLVAGDLVSALSTIVVDPPEGEMDAYLGSLERVAELGPRTVFPGHGPVLLGAEVFRRTRRHRLEREAAIRDAWRRGLRDGELVAAVYHDVDPALHPLAGRQVVAHLGRLRARGELAG